MALIDQYNLSQDSTFQGRVRIAAVAAAIAIHNETYTAITPQRDAFGKLVLLNTGVSPVHQLLALAVAQDATVAAAAGSPFNQASVSDTAINNAVGAVWNAFAVRN